MTENLDILQKEKNETMSDLYNTNMPTLKTGQFTTGKVVSIDRDGILVDIGYKSEGIIPIDELSFKKFDKPNEIVSIGENVDVIVLKVDNSEGFPILSKKKADTESSWRKIEKAHSNNEILEATVTDIVKGGILVDLGVKGFVPRTQIDIRPVRDLNDYLGEELLLKIIDIDRDKRKVVLSSRIVKEDEQKKLKTTTLDTLCENQVYTGKVSRIADFGAFIDLGGIDGLVHISEISQKRINNPQEVLKIGDIVEVLILKMDKEKGKISLSIKQAMADPWEEINKFRENTIIPGVVSKIANKYVFVEISEGIEGLIPIEELSNNRITNTRDILNVGDKINIKILSIQSEKRRITLSLKQAQNEELRKEYEEFLEKDETSGNFKLGSLLNKKTGANSWKKKLL